jgi:hypothetical protein
MNHVFVDYENIQQMDPDLIGSKAVTVAFFAGAKQFACSIQRIEAIQGA